VPADGLPAQRIGVLYFEDQSADSSLGPIADGLTEELIAQLGAVNALDVVSRNGVARFRGSAAAPDSIAAVLGTGTLVVGSVEPRGGALRVVVRVVDGESGADAKRASFQVPAAGLVAARDSVVDQVARFLRARIGEEVRMRETRRATTNDAAWSLSLQAERLAKNARALTKANDTVGASRARRRADSLLVRAAALDPAWPEPAVQRGRLALEELAVAAEPFTAQRWADSSTRAAEAALRLDPAHPGALALRGTVRLQRWRRHLEPDPRAAARLLAGAEADLKRATQLAPNDAAAWSTLARIYYEKPDLVEATLAARRAYETDAYLDNADRMLWNLYTTAYDNESFVDAVKWCDEGRQRFPDNPSFVRCQLWLFTTNARAPQPDQAWQLVSDLQAITPRTEWAYLGREARMLAAVAIGKAGLKDSADRVLKQARADAGVDPERDLLGTEALMRELLGQRDEALVLLKQYLVAKPEHRSLYANSQSWWWRGMKTDARFRALVGIVE
jgi:serine/threonine-protein kinase